MLRFLRTFPAQTVPPKDLVRGSKSYDSRVRRSAGYTHRAPVPHPKTIRIPPNTNTKKDTKDTYEYENNMCVHMLLLRSSPKPFPFLETVSVSFFHPVL